MENLPLAHRKKYLTMGSKGVLMTYINKGCASLAKGGLLMDWKNT